MINKRVITIAVFILFTTIGHVAYSNTPLIAGYLSPAPDEILTTVSADPLPAPVVGGIKMTYSGYTNYTNNDGYFSFPKHHVADEIRLVISNNISYDLLKNTVSRIEVDKKVSSSPLAVYRISKQKEPITDPNQAQSESKKNESPTTDTKTDSQTTDTSSANSCYFFKVESQGTTLPSGGLLSTDVIIHSDPSYFYLQDGAVYYAEESSHFIIPNNCIYLLKTPPQTTIERNDNLTTSVDAGLTTDTIDPKTSGTDSMGEALPGVERSVIEVGN